MPKQLQNFSSNWMRFDRFEELEAEDQSLLLAAREALKKAYAPYSNFHVGAALLLDNHDIVSGANYENAAYSMCLCAERSAIATAVSAHPGRQIIKIAITVRNPAKPVLSPAAPCGACRQVMVETEYRQQNDMRVIMQGEAGEVYVLPSSKFLLPFYFDGSYL
ncbi:MAG: cytidine deaminase [Saprospiraceae bacterium]